MKKYLSVYYEFLRTSFAEATSYRVNFFLLIIMDLFFYASSLAAVFFIFEHVDTIGPWNRDAFLFFIAFVLVVDHLHMCLVSEGFWEFSQHINQGTLDFILLKPIGSIFTIFFRYIRPASFLNIFPTWAALIYFGVQCDLSPISWVFIPFLAIFSLTLMVSFEILVSMLMFYTIDGFGINFLRMQFQTLARWPDFVFRFYTRKIFTFVFPVLLIGSAPVHFLLDFRQWHYLLFMTLGILAQWILIRYAYRYSLHRYESASS